jgi:streptomycin 6-kinase
VQEAIPIPRRLTLTCAGDLRRSAWLTQLPTLIREFQSRWSLTLGNPFDSHEVSCAWVAPVTLPSGVNAILKFGMPHDEGEHEIEGLQFWDGDPTVQLLAADKAANVMLLERCVPGSSLRTLPEPEQDVILARMFRRLWRAIPSLHPFRPLAKMLALWAGETRKQESGWTDSGLVQEGLRLFAELTATAPAEVLLATDLHAGNILQAEREPWLVIDPKPYVGDPAYDATQHIFNCQERLASRPMHFIQRMADLLELDCERIRLWTFARAAAEPRDHWADSPMLKLARMLAP